MEHACLTSTTNLHEEGLHNSECNRMKNMRVSFLKKWVGIVCFLMAILLSSSVLAVDNLIVSGVTDINSTVNGTYTPYTTMLTGTPQKTYNVWRFVNGSNTFYIYRDTYNYWNIGTDYTSSYLFYCLAISEADSPAGSSPWYDASDTNVSDLGFLITSASPEIAIFGNTIEIGDGSTTPSFSSNTKFGSVDVSSASVTKTFTIKNLGLSALSITGSSITGANTGDFTITTSPVGTIAASGQATLAFRFDPSAVGSRTATINIACNDADEATYNFDIQGYGYTPSNLVVYNISTPSAANGIYTHQGVLNGQYEYWMHSSGSYYIYRKAPDGLNYKWIIDSDTDVSTYLFTDYGISDYSPITDSWIASIGTGSPNVVSYVASPEIVVLGNATSISNNDATPRTADHTHFGTAEVGSGSVTRAFTIQNAGGTILQLSGSSPYIALSGSNASDFTVTTLPTTPMTAGNSTTFQITFTPLGEGAKTATVSIANNDSDENPFTFSIQGGGVYAKGLTVSGTSTVDGDYTYQGINADGFASWVHTSGTYRIYNSQYVPLDRRDWRIDTDTDPDNGVCFASPDFNTDPAPIGITPSSWAVGIGSIGNPVVVYYASEINIQGNGNSIANGDVTPITTDYTDFGSVLTSSGSVSHSFTIQNTGKGSLYLTGSPKVAISGTNASDFTVTTQPTSPLAATTGTTTFTVLFDPSAKGVRTATISIVNDDSDESPYTFSIQGTGLSAPTVTTQALSSIAATTATGNGNITDLGNPNPTSYGVCYGTTANPDVTGSKVDKGTASATGAFVAQLTGLNPGVTYHARAFATNSVETVYGADMTFTTSAIVPTVASVAATSPTSTGATLSGTVNANNASTVVTFEYGLTTAYGSSVTAAPSPVTGTSATSVSASLTGLTPNTTYHYRAKGVNSAGTTTGADMTFTTSAIVPTVTSVAATSPTSTGATLNGTVNANNASTVVTFEYGLTTAYGSSVTAAQSPVTGTSATSVSASLTGLTPNTTYHYRAKGVNSAGTTNGADMTFTTSAIVPTVASAAATSTTSTGATLNGTVNANNAFTVVTFEYGLTTAYGSSVTAAQSPVTGTSATSVSASLTGLTPNTTYHYRAKGVNSAGTTNGADMTFTTSAIVPTVASAAATSTTSTGATLNGTVNANNASTTVTFEYGTTTSYGSSITATPSPVTGTSATSVSAALTGLVPNTIYYYRVKGVNTAGTTNGAQMSFTTSAVAPTATSVAAISVTATAATLNGTVNANNASTTVTFEYGTTTAYGTTVTAAQSPVTGTSATSVTAALTGLTAGTTYHYRVIAVNTAETTYSADMTFVTSVVASISENRVAFEIYPNPCTDGFKVSGIDAPANVIITDLTGRVVVTTMVDVDGSVPVGHLKQGTYLVKVNERVLKLIKK